MQVTIDTDLCIDCNICIQVCPLGILANDLEGRPTVREGEAELCIRCGHCLSSCPNGALSLPFMKYEDCIEVVSPSDQSYDWLKSLVANRRSIRIYKDCVVPRPLIEELIQASSYAPTARNLQPVEWLVVYERNEVYRLCEIVIGWMKQMSSLEDSSIFPSLLMDKMIKDWESGQDRISRGAPHVIFAYGPESLPASLGSCFISLTTMELLTYSNGLGACWAGYLNIAANNHPPMLEALGLPGGHMPVGALMLGYPKYPYYRVPQRNQPVVTWR